MFNWPVICYELYWIFVGMIYFLKDFIDMNVKHLKSLLCIYPFKYFGFFPFHLTFRIKCPYVYDVILTRILEEEMVTLCSLDMKLLF